MEIDKTTTRFKLSEAPSSIQDDWTNLAKVTGANFSLYPGWTGITAGSHQIAASSVLLAKFRDDKLVAVFPTCESTGRFGMLPLKALGLVGNYVSYHNHLITSLKPCDAIGAIIEEGIARKTDLVHLAAIPDDSDIGRYLKTGPKNKHFRTHAIAGESSPFLPLDKGWDDLLASKPKKFRYKLRKRSELLNSAENMTMQWYDKTANVAALLDAMQIVEENSWKKNAGVSIFEKDHERLYHEMLLPYLASQNAMFANVLFFNEVAIAYNLCCVWDGWVGQMKTSFDTRHAEISPGSIVIDSAIRHAIELGATEFDFLGDMDPHKLAWTKSVRSHTSYFLYLRSSLKGNIVGLLKDIRRRYAV
jgi:CelD/BcsL family acetyltransferase involved in cellulose biosynthesis